MKDHFFYGDLVYLTAEDPETLANAYPRWWRASEFMRLMDSAPRPLFSKDTMKRWLEKDHDKSAQDKFGFAIRTLEDDRLVGDVGLDGVNWAQGDAFVGIGLGEKQDWGKGYGTDAMQVLLRFAFLELNLRRVSLDVFEYNPRALRSYLKAGFVVEGRSRRHLNREGRRWDMIYMGILREEWEHSLSA